jgi:hypothetical protein
MRAMRRGYVGTGTIQVVKACWQNTRVEIAWEKGTPIRLDPLKVGQWPCPVRCEIENHLASVDPPFAAIVTMRYVRYD